MRGALQTLLHRLSGQNDPYWDDFINRSPNDVRNMITEIVAKAPEGGKGDDGKDGSRMMFF